MRGRWIVGIAACLAAGVGIWLVASVDPDQTARQGAVEPTDVPFVQTAQQIQIPPKGFDDARAARVEEIHAHNLAALDDLDPANGIRRIKTAEGERIVNVDPRFGGSRMDVMFTHNGEMTWTGTKRPGTGTSDPFMLIVSAHGKPLTAENLSWQKPAKQPFTPLAEAARTLTETEKRSAKRMEALKKESDKRRHATQKQRLDALRRLVSRANEGRDSGFETSDAYGWAKPLKLTKNECLPCHQGMKVGDTVGIIAYMYGK
ncbi:MAG: hypothetical protein M3R13_04535 [Armatimonadota bacterium]|nr:hypothetical protein [Armatimonadota bacterium]